MWSNEKNYIYPVDVDEALVWTQGKKTRTLIRTACKSF